MKKQRPKRIRNYRMSMTVKRLPDNHWSYPWGQSGSCQEYRIQWDKFTYQISQDQSGSYYLYRIKNSREPHTDWDNLEKVYPYPAKGIASCLFWLKKEIGERFGWYKPLVRLKRGPIVLQVF